jgi:hypothetical protein
VDTDTLRDVQVSIFPKNFQVSNGYMQLIAFINLVSNRRPEKCGFEAIKRANP